MNHGNAMPDFRALRLRFPTLLDRVYFATHNLGPVLNETLVDLDEYRRTIALRNRALEPWLQRIDEMRGLVARLVNAKVGEIALGPNATACQANLAAALRPGSNRDVILTTNLDFPSSRYLWQAQEQRGFLVRTVASHDGISMPVDALVDAIDERTAVVAVSLVAYTNGALLRVKRVIDAAHAAGALVVLDAYQAAGIVPIDVRALDVDVLVAGTQKWLCATGSGLAFLYVKEQLANSLDPAYPGWFSHADTLAFADSYVPAAGARRFEQGAPAIEAVYAAGAGIRFALEVGVEAMRARSLELSDRLIAGADALGIPLRMPRARAERAGVVCLAIPDPARTATELRGQGIDVDTRPGTGLRLSTHPCNTDEDCDRVLAELARNRR
jgi:kynureninase